MRQAQISSTTSYAPSVMTSIYLHPDHTERNWEVVTVTYRRAKKSGRSSRLWPGSASKSRLRKAS